ncbi:MAG: DUF3179 domain-containing protein [Clostridiales bacterium]|jgi:hypothetical protein|nr:DUF3179 domain-containing protein [Clostridiales bacterium]
MKFRQNIIKPAVGTVIILSLFLAGCNIGQKEGGQVVLPRESILGFDVSFSLIPVEEIKAGGPPKDGIPAITSPEVLSAGEAGYLSPKDLVIGVAMDGEARAYPLKILMWHEIVNDELAGHSFAVTYCPLCNSGLVFNREVGGEIREFGVSGLLWQSNVLMYDRQQDTSVESLWSQAQMRAVTGPAARDDLMFELLSSQLVSWEEWLQDYPETTVISDRTGFTRNYGGDPYASYFATDKLMFPVDKNTDRPAGFTDKEMMVVVFANNEARAYAVSDVAAQAQGILDDELGGRVVHLQHAGRSNSVTVSYADSDDSPPVAYMFWFVLSSQLPEIEIYRPN